MNLPHNIRSMIEEKLQSMGLELYSVKYFRAGSRAVLRICIDRDEPVTIDDCERVSRDLSVMLDVENFSPGPYTLEVSSPGTDRPLVSERDFLRNKGRQVRIQLCEAIGDKKGYCGTVHDCSNGVLSLEVDGRQMMFPLAKITQARIELAF